MNRQDITQQVTTTLGDRAQDFNIDGIVDDLISESYWSIVETHDQTA